MLQRPPTNATKPFQRCMLMCGGGFRCAYYLGAYHALVSANQRPDLLLAACGGAIAAALIATHADALAALKHMQSAAMFTALQKLTANAQFSWVRAMFGVLKRKLSDRPASLDELTNNTLFAALAHPALSEQWHAQAPNIAILLSSTQLSNALERRLGPWRRWLWGFPADALHGNSLLLPKDCELIGGGHVIANNLTEAVALSCLDPYYFPPLVKQQHLCLGGAIDLFPVDIADALAQSVIGERKASVDWWLTAPAWRRVWQIDGQARQRLSDQYPFQYCFDSKDVSKLANLVDRQFSLLSNRLSVGFARSLSIYQERVQQQFDYGVLQMTKAMTA